MARWQDNKYLLKLWYFLGLIYNIRPCQAVRRRLALWRLALTLLAGAGDIDPHWQLTRPSSGAGEISATVRLWLEHSKTLSDSLSTLSDVWVPLSQFQLFNISVLACSTLLYHSVACQGLIPHCSHSAPLCKLFLLVSCHVSFISHLSSYKFWTKSELKS